MEKYGAVNVEPATREVMLGYKQVSNRYKPIGNSINTLFLQLILKYNPKISYLFYRVEQQLEPVVLSVGRLNTWILDWLSCGAFHLTLTYTIPTLLLVWSSIEDVSHLQVIGSIRCITVKKVHIFWVILWCMDVYMYFYLHTNNCMSSSYTLHKIV